jgi:carboxynorspermidine decarboxylase
MDEALLRANAQCLGGPGPGARLPVLLAQKAFSNYDFYPLLAEELAGTEASGLYEARLGRSGWPAEVHVFCGAYRGR